MPITSIDKLVSKKIKQTPIKWGGTTNFTLNAVIPEFKDFILVRNLLNSVPYGSITSLGHLINDRGGWNNYLSLLKYLIVFELLGCDEDTYQKIKDSIINSLVNNSRTKLTKQQVISDVQDILDTIINTPELCKYLERQATRILNRKPVTTTAFYRIVVYDTGYNPPARKHVLLVGKELNTGKYKVSMGSSQFGANQSWYDEPYFDSKQQAQNFIDNFSNIQTSTNISALKTNIIEKPADDGKISNLQNMVLVNTICGPCYMHEEAVHFEENLKENITMIKPSILENIEKHDVLNPKLFTDKETLKPEVKNKINEIVNEFVDMLAEDEIKINIKDIILVGSNVSYNYTKDSDLDVHIIADTKNLQCPDNLYPKLYSAYRSLFNKKFNIDFYDIPVEIYVETDETPRVSNGVYSVMKDTWLKAPVQQDIPDIDIDEFNKDFQEWKDRYEEVSNSGDIAAIEQYIDDVYELRKIGLAEGGEYDVRNLTFKEVRNLGYLDNLKELINELKSKELSLENEIEIVDNTDEEENIYDGELDEVLFEMISRTDREMYIQKIRQAVYDQPILKDNGIFYIYLVKENDVNDKIARLKRLDFIKNVYATPGKYDFSKINFKNGMPSRYYTIIGQIKD